MTPVTISLDRPRQIVFTQRALYRMSTLAAPFEFDDLQKSKKSYGALCAWLWACLAPADAQDFASPEDVSEFVPAKRDVCQKLAGSLADAINAGSAEKNAHCSTPGTSPASS